MAQHVSTRCIASQPAALERLVAHGASIDDARALHCAAARNEVGAQWPTVVMGHVRGRSEKATAQKTAKCAGNPPGVPCSTD